MVWKVDGTAFMGFVPTYLFGDMNIIICKTDCQEVSTRNSQARSSTIVLYSFVNIDIDMLKDGIAAWLRKSESLGSWQVLHHRGTHRLVEWQACGLWWGHGRRFTWDAAQCEATSIERVAVLLSLIGYDVVDKMESVGSQSGRPEA